MSDAGETVQQLALQGHPVPLNLLLLRKSILTLDGITRQPSCEPGAFHSRGSTGPISIVPGCPRERSGLISRAHPKNVFAFAQNLLTRLCNPCDVLFRGSRIARSPREAVLAECPSRIAPAQRVEGAHNENKEKKKGQNMSATDTVLVSCADRIVWVRAQGGSTRSRGSVGFQRNGLGFLPDD